MQHRHKCSTAKDMHPRSWTSIGIPNTCHGSSREKVKKVLFCDGRVGAPQKIDEGLQARNDDRL